MRIGRVQMGSLLTPSSLAGHQNAPTRGVTCVTSMPRQTPRHPRYGDRYALPSPAWPGLPHVVLRRHRRETLAGIGGNRFVAADPPGKIDQPHGGDDIKHELADHVKRQ